MNAEYHPPGVLFLLMSVWQKRSMAVFYDRCGNTHVHTFLALIEAQESKQARQKCDSYVLILLGLHFLYA
jgi:hypothetical protein